MAALVFRRFRNIANTMRADFIEWRADPSAATCQTGRKGPSSALSTLAGRPGPYRLRSCGRTFRTLFQNRLSRTGRKKSVLFNVQTVTERKTYENGHR
jgi:hypothetical protein